MSRNSSSYFNFINTLNSELTKKKCSTIWNNFCSIVKISPSATTADQLNKLLKISENKIADFIIKYLVQKKVSRSSKKVIFATIKHACEIDDVVLNWKKIEIYQFRENR